MLLGGSTTMDRAAAHNDSPRPSIRVTARPLSPPYLDLDDEPTPTPHRMASWSSDATVVRTEDDLLSTPSPKSSEDGTAVDFDFGDDDPFKPRSRRLRWATFCLAFAWTVL